MEGINNDKIKAGLKVFKNMEDSRLLTHLNSCVHCGLCAESCIYYLTFGEGNYIPAKKVDIVASIYQRYHSLSGKLFPKLLKARELTDENIAEMVDLLYGSCTLCGRCVKHCSIGVDIEYVVRKGREMLANMGYVPVTLQATVNAAITTGNNMAITDEELRDTLNWLEEDLRLEVNDEDACIPLDKYDVQVLYTLNPREPKFFPLSIVAMAKVFYSAKESWTLSSKMYDVTNYGYFSCNIEEASEIARRLYEETKKLNAKSVALAECGHGSRSFRWEAPNYLKKEFDFEVMTSVELLADYIRKGRIKVDPKLNQERVTLHDPCNLVRSGGIFSEQRYILNQAVSDFVEMQPFGYDNYCCGGGGGQLSMSEYNERRMKCGEIKAEQIRKSGAKIVATPCHNCVDQLIQINVAYKLNVQIKTLAEIVADAIVLDI